MAKVSSIIKEGAKNLKVTKLYQGEYYAECLGVSYKITYNEMSREWNYASYDTVNEVYEWCDCEESLAEARFYLQHSAERAKANPDAYSANYGLDPLKGK